MTQLFDFIDVDSYSQSSDNLSTMNRVAAEVATQQAIDYCVTGELTFYSLAAKNTYKVLTHINGGQQSESIAEQLLPRQNAVFYIAQYQPDQEGTYVINNNQLELKVYTPDDQEIVPAVTVTAGISIVSYWS